MSISHVITVDLLAFGSKLEIQGVLVHFIQFLKRKTLKSNHHAKGICAHNDSTANVKMTLL